MAVKINRFVNARPPGSRTDIDDLIRFEQLVNFLNAPVILMQGPNSIVGISGGVFGFKSLLDSVTC